MLRIERGDFLSVVRVPWAHESNSRDDSGGQLRGSLGRRDGTRKSQYAGGGHSEVIRHIQYTPRPPPVAVWKIATPGTSPVHARPVEAPTSRFDSRGCPVYRHPRPRAEEAGRISSTRLLQLADVERLPRAKNEIWYQGSETPRSGRRVTRVVSQAARGALEHASSPPLSSTLCALRAQAIDAAQGQPGREGRR